MQPSSLIDNIKCVVLGSTNLSPDWMGYFMVYVSLCYKIKWSCIKGTLCNLVFPPLHMCGRKFCSYTRCGYKHFWPKKYANNIWFYLCCYGESTFQLNLWYFQAPSNLILSAAFAQYDITGHWVEIYCAGGFFALFGLVLTMFLRDPNVCCVVCFNPCVKMCNICRPEPTPDINIETEFTVDEDDNLQHME